jgi:hypothetical protein
MLVVAGQAVASTPGPCLGCEECHNCDGPAHVFLTVAVFGDSASISLNGSDYDNGQLAVLQAGVPVAVSTNSLTGFIFGFWESDLGNFSNAKSSSTTFTPISAGGIGTLAMVLNDSSLTGQSWSGYAAGSGASGVSCAGGTYDNVPLTTYVGNGWPTEDGNSIWVGIGGVVSSDLWQAGILVTYTGDVGGGGNTLSWQFFAEAATGSDTQGPTDLSSAHTNFPSELIISVCTSSGTNTASLEAYYASSHTGIWWNRTVSSFTPDTYTADWIVEDPINTANGDRYPLGAFAPFGAIYPSWTVGGTSYNEFLGPLTYFSLTDTAYGTQFVTPGEITGDFGQYPISYST